MGQHEKRGRGHECIDICQPFPELYTSTASGEMAKQANALSILFPAGAGEKGKETKV